eukprot:TRINITY_DN5057_c0_g4_i1.p1 TRINITY_DN5057_c0_g4~~TRINITY_DN5057_c0_g4_i1.p1  ORF type:complete len:164 (+),score=29.14 TRINITY_DN5057_c0_g4_i1:596-1087(+)
MLEAMTKTGKQFVSRFGSSGAAVFSPPRSQRFLTPSKVCRQLVDKKTPGPGYYSTHSSISGNGAYCLSKYRSVFCRAFGGQSKTALSKPLEVPGPGAYQAPSEFGVYRAQSKYVRESERVDRLRSASVVLRGLLKSKTSGESYEGNTNASELVKKSISVDYKE